MSIVLGLDVAATTGYALIRQTPTGPKVLAYGAAPARTAADVQNALTMALAVLGDERPARCAIEAGYCGPNVRTGLQLAELRGRFRQLLELAGVECELIAPSAWRKTQLVTPPKSKRAELKRAARAAVKERFGIEATADEADAVLLACHAASSASPEILSTPAPQSSLT